MTDSPVRQQLNEELRKLLVAAAADSGVDTQRLAQTIADGVANRLKGELGLLAPKLTLSQLDREVIVGELKAALPGVLLANSDKVASNMQGSGSGFDPLPQGAHGGAENRHAEAGNGSFWMSARAVALSALGVAILLTVFSAMMISSSLAPAADSASPSEPAPQVAAAIAETPEKGWAVLAKEFPFGANLPRATACGDETSACEGWPKVRDNLAGLDDSKAAYVQKFAEQVKERSTCSEDIAPVSGKADFRRALDVIDTCLEQVALSGD
jgi:hypothetical protein